MRIDKEERTYIDENGRLQITLAISEKPEDELCDFCSGEERPYTEYKCKDFSTGGGLNSLGNWNACAKCMPMIEANDIEGLCDRSLLMGAGRIDHIPEVREHFRRLFNLFHENRIK